MESCKHCKNEITGNFCSNCGQKRHFRLDRRYILDELQAVLIQANKGLLYSLKRISFHPGKTAKEFIDGDRVSHYKPISLAFVLSGISTFLSYKFLSINELTSTYYRENNMNQAFSDGITQILPNYTPLLMVLLIPFFALTTRITFRKAGHNYYEHVVLNSYFLSFYTLVSIILVPIMLLFKQNSSSFFLITQSMLLIIPMILVWFFKEVYSERSLFNIAWRVLAIMGLVGIGFVVCIVVLTIILVVFSPEVFLNARPK